MAQVKTRRDKTGYIPFPINPSIGNPQVENINSSYNYVRIVNTFVNKEKISKEIDEISTVTASKILDTSKSDFILRELDEELTSLSASQDTLFKTRSILKSLVEEVTERKLEWIYPILYMDDEKSVCVEWRKNDRNLYFDIDEDRSRYSKMWKVGEAFKTMPGNIINSELLTLWIWLLHEKE